MHGLFENQIDGGSPALARAQFDAPTRLLHDPLADSQTQPRARAFGGVKRQKDVLESRGRDAGAVVLDADDDEALVLVGPATAPYANPAGLRDSVRCVAKEIHQDLPKLLGGHRDPWQFLFEVGLHAQRPLRPIGPNHLEGSTHHRIHVNGYHGTWRLARQVKHRADHAIQPIHLFENDAEVFFGTGVQGSLVGAWIIEQLCCTFYCTQWIANLVRKPGCELPQYGQAVPFFHAPIKS